MVVGSNPTGTATYFGTVLGPSLLVKEGIAGLTVDRLIKACEVAEKLLSGKPVELKEVVRWNEDVKREFIDFMKANSRDRNYIKDCVRYLDKYVSDIAEPRDIVEIFKKCKRERHHLDRALRNLLKFYKVVKGYSEEWIDKLKKAIPSVRVGVDLREPSEKEVVETFKKLENKPLKYRALFHVILDSGIRLSHAIQLINSFNEERLEKLDRFYRYAMGLEKGTKHTYYVYMRERTVEMLKRVKGSKLTKSAVMSFLKRNGLLSPKLLRKFAYNKMVMSGIPESVADFINGRKPRTVGATHYLFPRTQADEQYPKYLAYLDTLLPSR